MCGNRGEKEIMIIMVEKTTAEKVKALRNYDRESYDSIIQRLVGEYLRNRENING